MTVDESARHTHGQNINGNGNAGWNNSYGELVTLPDNDTGNGQEGYSSSGLTWVSGGNRVYTSETGGNKPHNNMQPYQVVYIFKRTA